MHFAIVRVGGLAESQMTWSRAEVAVEVLARFEVCEAEAGESLAVRLLLTI